MTALLPASYIDQYRSFPTPWGFNGLGEIVYARTYSRLVPDLYGERKETWPETVLRSVNGAQAIGAKLTYDEMETLFQLMMELKASVSGRALWQLGTPLVEDIGGASLMNCMVSPVTDFPFIMDMLMVGVGVGYSVERSMVYELPTVKLLDRRISHEPTPDADLIVSDKREGWSELLRRIVEAYTVTGRGFSYSTIVLRSAGQPLKRFGGTSSGPVILVEGMNEIISIFESRAGKKLRSVDALDIACIIGKIVKAGNARRSAQLSSGDPDDHLYSKAKNWKSGNVPAYRGNVNVSIHADSFDEIPAWYWRSGWAGDGEIHGLLNRGLARTTGRTGERSPDPKVVTTNPCVTGDTWVMTDEGARRVADLTGRPFTAIVDGSPYRSSGFWSTGRKPIVKLTLNDGQELRLTPDHKIMASGGGWVEARSSLGKEIVLHDHQGLVWGGDGTEDLGYVVGSLIGDGTFGNYAELRSWDPANDLRGRLQDIVGGLGTRSDWKGWRPTQSGYDVLQSAGLTHLASTWGVSRGSKKLNDLIESGSSDFTVGVLRGLFDTDGHVEGNRRSGISIRLSQSDYDLLVRAQRMLARLGIRSSIHRMKDGGPTVLPGGVYDCKPSWRLIITGAHASRYMGRIGFGNASKSGKWDRLTSNMPRGFYSKSSSSQVVSIEDAGVEEVFDCSVDIVHAFDANGLYVANCGEVFLEPYESCNLATLFVPNITSFEEFTTASHILYKIQKATALFRHPDPRTQAVMRRNMRLGQSVTGIAQSTEEQLSWLDPGYQSLKEFDRSWSKETGVKPSIRLSSLQPSGTMSLLPGVTPGLHPAEAQYYIRRVRFGADDELVGVARKRGYNVVPEMNQDGTIDHTKWVVEFPAESPEGALLVEKTTAVAQLDLVARMQKEWADNAVSVTVKFTEDEVPTIKEWLRENYETQLKSVSFMKHTGHGFVLPPYEPITEDEYRRTASRIDLSIPLQGTSSEELDMADCAGGACPIR